MTIFKCSNCHKDLLPGDRRYCEENLTSECAECTFHALNGTRTIGAYNNWLRGEKEQKPEQ